MAPEYRASPAPRLRLPLEAVVPTGEIVLEGEAFPAPRRTEQFLEALYGYLGEGAVYDAATGKYRPGPTGPTAV